MLDYVYERNGKDAALEINTESAAALHKLGEYFGMRRLRWDSKAFWKNDMNLDNLHTYFQHAQLFQDKKIMVQVAKILVENIMEVKPSSKIVVASDVELWLRVLEQLPLSDNPESAGIHVSELIGEYALENAEDLTPKIFGQLTAEEKLPVVSNQAAMRFMEAWDRLNLNKEKKPGCTLQSRCVKALASHWGEMVNMTESDTQLLKKRDASFLNELLAKSLEEATKGKKQLEKNRKDLRRKLAKDLKNAESERDSLKGRLAKAKSQADKYAGYWMTEMGKREEGERNFNKAKKELEAAQLDWRRYAASRQPRTRKRESLDRLSAQLDYERNRCNQMLDYERNWN